MVVGKPNRRLPAKTKNGIDLISKKVSESVNHWDFLNEIEAPMWVDLTVECNSAYEDKDDEWFCTSHLFHQSSSQELKAAFSRIGEVSADIEFGTQQPSSPNLPPSVSRSRGKDYRSREWGKGNSKIISLDKKHPIKNLNSKSSQMNSRFTKPVKDKQFKASNSVLVGQSSTQPASTHSSLATEEGKNNSEDSGEKQHQKSSGTSSSGSTITYESTEQCNPPEPRKCTEVSSHLHGRTSDFLSTLRVSLRKSCVTRQALRVVVNSPKESDGQKSSSSKSSVGSSNTHKDITPDSGKVYHPQKEKPKLQLMHKGKQHHTHATQRKALVPIKGKGDLASNKIRKDKESTGRSKCNRKMATGKENKPGAMAVSEKSNFRARTTTVLKEQVPKTSLRTTSVSSKVRLQDKRDVKNP